MDARNLSRMLRGWSILHQAPGDLDKMKTDINQDDMQFMVAVAILGFGRSVSILEDNSTEQAAERACLDSRWAFALILSAMPEFLEENRSYVQDFADKLDVACFVVKELDPVTKESTHYLTNMLGRSENLRMLLRGASAEEIRKQMAESLEAEFA